MKKEPTRRISDEKKSVLREQFTKAANDYLNALLEMWELDAYYGYWNSDQPGTIYHYGETHNLSMDDIIYCVDNDVDEGTVLAWEDYILDCSEFGFSIPNLPAWCNNYPRIEEATFQRLRKMKEQLKQAIDEEKARQEDNKNNLY